MKKAGQNPPTFGWRSPLRGESFLQQIFRYFAITEVVPVQRPDNSGWDNSSRRSQQT
jgi:hypothetical protein